MARTLKEDNSMLTLSDAPTSWAGGQVQSKKVASAGDGTPAKMKDVMKETLTVPIVSYDPDSDYLEYASAAMKASIAHCKDERRIVRKAALPVLVNNRVYFSAKSAGRANGISNIPRALRLGETEVDGVSIAYADPALEEIRMENVSVKEDRPGFKTLSDLRKTQSPHIQRRDKQVKAAWKLPKQYRGGVKVGSLYFQGCAHAAGWDPSLQATLSLALRHKLRSWKGKPIGYADPAIEAIRLGVKQEDYVAGNKKAAKKTEAKKPQRAPEAHPRSRAVVVDDREFPSIGNAESFFGKSHLAKALSKGRSHWNGHAIRYADEGKRTTLTPTNLQPHAQRVVVNGVTYPSVKAAERFHQKSNLTNALQRGQRVWHGMPVSYAAEGGESGKTQREAVARIVRLPDGLLAIEGKFDFKTAIEIRSLCERVLAVEQKVSFE